MLGRAGLFLLSFKSAPAASKTNQETHTGALREESSTGMISHLLGEAGLSLQPLLVKDREHHKSSATWTPGWLLTDHGHEMYGTRLVNEAEVPIHGFSSLAGLLD